MTQLTTHKNQLGAHNVIPAFLSKYRRRNTIRAYQSDLNAFFGTDVVSLEMCKAVDFIQVNGYIDSLKDQDYAGTTIQRRITAVSTLYDWLQELGMIDRSPIGRHITKRIKAKSKESVWLSAKDASKLLKQAKRHNVTGVRDHAIITVMLYCALRRSEVTQIRTNDIATAGQYDVLNLPQTKSGENQQVKLTSHVLSVLQNHMQHYNIVDGYLFLSLSNNSAGKPLSDGYIYKMIRKHARNAGFDDVGAHTLRHTSVTLAIEAGSDINDVKTHARHKSITTTEIYMHRADKYKNASVDLIKIKE